MLSCAYFIDDQYTEVLGEMFARELVNLNVRDESEFVPDVDVVVMMMTSSVAVEEVVVCKPE